MCTPRECSSDEKASKGTSRANERKRAPGISPEPIVCAPMLVLKPTVRPVAVKPTVRPVAVKPTVRPVAVKPVSRSRSSIGS